MKNRNPIAVFFLPLVTFGIYAIIWLVKTKNEMNNQGANIPTAWLIIIPFVSLYWLWKYAEGVEKVTNGKQSQVLAFVLLFLLGIVGYAVIQSDFNTATSVSMPTTFTPVGASPYAQPTVVAPVQPQEATQPVVQPQPPVKPQA
jgi:hypothetical protein